MDREVIKDADGNVVGEIREENGSFVVWKREKPSFPPKTRHSLMGSAPNIEEARKLAAKLLG
ncbi:MAG: hypothetical protein R3174_08645 [Gammaproteobacteria bacterium]|nr:hypothetical protein [Gammaproteobacteria bacterium]